MENGGLIIMKKYILNILISIDQLVNTLFGGDPDETISSRLGKSPNSIMAKILNPLLNLFQKDHSKKSIEEDEGKDAVSKD
jgi:hypothetical protein